MRARYERLLLFTLSQAPVIILQFKAPHIVHIYVQLIFIVLTHQAVVRAVVTHESNARIVEYGCWAISNLTASIVENNIALGIQF